VGYDYLYDDRLGYPGRPLVPATWVETATADGSIASTAGDMAAFAPASVRPPFKTMTGLRGVVSLRSSKKSPRGA